MMICMSLLAIEMFVKIALTAQDFMAKSFYEQSYSFAFGQGRASSCCRQCHRPCRRRRRRRPWGGTPK